jgi:SsrA-binding protein
LPLTEANLWVILPKMKVVAQNRRARFDYEILETYEAGIQLTGPEVKSCRAGHVNLSGAYVSFLKNKPMIKHMTISAYPFASVEQRSDPERERLLLMKKSELGKLESLTAEKGVTIIPLEVKAGKYIKVVLGVARGRKTLDKRQHIKERDMARNLRQGRDV